MSVRPSVYLQVHFRRKGGSRLRCSPPSLSLFLLDPPKSTPSPDHGKSLNPTFLPSHLPLTHTVASSAASSASHRSHCGSRGSLACSLGRSVPLWTSIHPVHAEKRRGCRRGRARVFTELTWTCCVQAQQERTFALSTLIHLFWYSFFKLQHAH